MTAVLVRHGETEWTITGRHTGSTDLPLTADGRTRAIAVAPALSRFTFAAVFCSPLLRARETCELAGYGEVAKTREDLREWNYGEYEGLTSKEIHTTRPDWMVFRDGCPGGESPDEIVRRVSGVIADLRAIDGDVLIFAHGHILRSLASVWVELPLITGDRLALDPGSISELGYEHEHPVLRRWNAI